MEKYVAVDSGKYATKYAYYDEKKKEILKSKFRTKISPGRMDDDEIEAGTFIAEIEGKVYKIGKGASQEAELETTKKTEIHRICTLAALAIYASDKEEDLFHVAVGIPVLNYEDRESKLEYKKYILPELKYDDKKSKETGTITYNPSDTVEVKLKLTSDSVPVIKRFRIASKRVCPESSGVLYLDPIRFADGTTAVLDLGNLNINGTCWNNFEYDKESSITDELGGNILISGLSKKLTTEFSRCDTTFTARILRKPLEDRKLVPINKNPEIEERSKKVIHDYLYNHVKAIKRECDAKHWSLDFMNMASLPEKTPASYFSESVAIIASENANMIIPAASCTDDYYRAMADNGLVNRIPSSKLNQELCFRLLRSRKSNVLRKIPEEFKTRDLMEVVVTEGLYDHIADITDYLSKELVAEAVRSRIVTSFDEIPVKFQSQEITELLIEQTGKIPDIPEGLQTEEICSKWLQCYDKAKYEWLCTLKKCKFKSKDNLDYAVRNFADAVTLGGLSKEQIQISVEKFPLNILKVPAWYFEKAAVKKPEPDLMPENVSFVQMSIFDIIGTY